MPKTFFSRFDTSCRSDIVMNQMSKKNTVYEKKSDLDQFYTSSHVAKLCYDQIWKLYSKQSFSLYLEPSAGSGSFLMLMPEGRRLGLDLDPKNDEVQKMDFFEFLPPKDKKKIITIGNPPFGKMCSLAVKFFNKAAKFSTTIAFIIPKTFRKTSLQNKLDLRFHLKFDMDLPKNSFVFNGKEYDVPCCFQIWEKSKVKRVISKVDLTNNFFDFTSKEDANLAIRRVGGRAGKATFKVADLSPTCYYFLKYKHAHILAQDFASTVNGIDFADIVNSTAGVRSLSKPELIQALSKMFPGEFAHV